jgi:hypothetical protein
MPFEDEWGHDPSVQSMRRVFSLIETAQEELLRHLNISPFDPRLRRSREQALKLFEQAWPLAVTQGIIGNDKEAAPLYLHCMARALSSAGVEVSKELLPRDDKITRLLQKELS